MMSYSPYDNVATRPGRHAARYPDLLVTAGLNDPRVGYWEPAKWVAKIRALSPATRVLLRTELGAGHGGPSGRYDAWKEEALVFAFLLDALDMCPRPVRSAGEPAVTKCMVNGVRKPDGRVTGVPSTEAASTVGAPTTTVTGPVAPPSGCAPGCSVPVKSVDARRRVRGVDPTRARGGREGQGEVAARHLVRRSRGRAGLRQRRRAGAGVDGGGGGRSTRGDAPPADCGGRAADPAVRAGGPPCANPSPGARRPGR